MNNYQAPTRFIGKKTKYLDCCESTNVLGFQEALSLEIPEGFAWIAGQQTAGKGQRGNQWLAQANQNLLVSYLLKPTHELLPFQFFLSKAIAIGIVEGLQLWSNATFGEDLPLEIKWPNDIYVNDCKLGGVLIETTNQSNAVKSVIIGVGINLNQTVFNRQNATSIKKLRGTFTKTEDVLWMLCDSLTRYENELGDYNLLKESYENNLYRLREKSPFQLGNQRVEGEIIGVSSQGQLKIRIADEVQLVEHGQLTWIFQ